MLKPGQLHTAMPRKILRTPREMSAQRDRDSSLNIENSHPFDTVSSDLPRTMGVEGFRYILMEIFPKRM